MWSAEVPVEAAQDGHEPATRSAAKPAIRRRRRTGRGAGQGRKRSIAHLDRKSRTGYDSLQDTPNRLFHQSVASYSGWNMARGSMRVTCTDAPVSAFWPE